MTDTTTYDTTTDELANLEEVLKLKAANTRATRIWRAHLWSNVPQAILFANEGMVFAPGEVVFNIRDNGQVWTYSLF